MQTINPTTNRPLGVLSILAENTALCEELQQAIPPALDLLVRLERAPEDFLRTVALGPDIPQSFIVECDAELGETVLPVLCLLYPESKTIALTRDESAEHVELLLRAGACEVVGISSIGGAQTVPVLEQALRRAAARTSHRRELLAIRGLEDKYWGQARTRLFADLEEARKQGDERVRPVTRLAFGA